MRQHPEAPWYHPQASAVSFVRIWTGTRHNAKEEYDGYTIVLEQVIFSNKVHWFKQTCKALLECYEYVKPF